jgi:hypothetical protein
MNSLILHYASPNFGSVPTLHVSAFFIVLAVKAQIRVWLWGVNHELGWCSDSASCVPLGQSQSCTSRTYQHLRPAVLTTGGAGCSSATREKPYPSTCQ